MIPPPRTGACGAPRCDCATYRQVRLVAMWPTCDCGHSQASHQRQDTKS